MKFHLWLYFIIFAVIILIVLWCLQILFLNAYYQLMKTNELNSAAVRITEQYGTDNFQNTMQQLAFENNLNVVLMDEQGNIITSADMTGNAAPRMPRTEVFGPLEEKLRESPEQSALVSMDDPKFHYRMIVYGKWLTSGTGEREMLFITSPLEPIGSTVNILKSQLIYISIILLALAFAVSFFLSRRLSKTHHPPHGRRRQARAGRLRRRIRTELLQRDRPARQDAQLCDKADLQSGRDEERPHRQRLPRPEDTADHDQSLCGDDPRPLRREAQKAR